MIKWDEYEIAWPELADMDIETFKRHMFGEWEMTHERISRTDKPA